MTEELADSIKAVEVLQGKLDKAYSCRPRHEIIAPFAFSGSMDGDLFEGWLEYILVPEFKNPAKSVLILDNASCVSGHEK